jgi:hypothetical protein
MRIILAMTVMLALSGCGVSGEAEGRKLLEASLTDPGSVQYRGLFSNELTPGKKYICGEYNAKNQMGGYVGYRRFIADLNGGTAFTEAREDDLGPNAKLAAGTFGLQWSVYCARQ